MKNMVSQKRSIQRPCFEFLYYFSELAGVGIDSLVRPGIKPAAADSDPFSLPFYTKEFNEIVDLMKKSPVVLAGIITLASDFIRKNKSMIENNLKLEMGTEKDEK